MLQTSGKCSHTARMLRFPGLSRHSPTLVEGRRRIGLQLAELLKLKESEARSRQRRGP